MGWLRLHAALEALLATPSGAAEVYGGLFYWIHQFVI